MMRILYVGLDRRERVAQANRVKFLPDGFQSTDKAAEREDGMTGPLLIAHVYRSKGGKRVTLKVPAGFDMAAAKRQLLEQGWLDLSACEAHSEILY